MGFEAREVLQVGRAFQVRNHRQPSATAALLAVLVSIVVGFNATPADAEVHQTELLPGGVQRIEYWAGPLNVTPGQNRIDNRILQQGTDRPAVDGWITRIEPNLVDQDGTVPDSSKVMFHHGVWINQSGFGSGYSQNFYGTGEEKTTVDLPDGYGLRYRKNQGWILNHMIHNLIFQPRTMYITYTIDFIPDTAPEAAGITEVKPIWMDVEDGSNYPVFDVYKGSGRDGKFTYPQDADDPYRNAWQKNVNWVPHDGVLVNTTGHVHTGGLSTELYLNRNGARDESPACVNPDRFKAKINRLRRTRNRLSRQIRTTKKRLRSRTRRFRDLLARADQPRSVNRLARLTRLRGHSMLRLKRLKAKRKMVVAELNRTLRKRSAADRAYGPCLASKPAVKDGRVNLFDSRAVYFDPRGPISWDMAMRTTPDDWKVQVKQGDRLELQTTYETERASWYESMGINVVYMAEEAGGRNPYAVNVADEGVLNHGHTSENEDYGGEDTTGLPDPSTLADGLLANDPITVGGPGSYIPGGLSLTGDNGRPPVIQQGQKFTFQMSPGSLNSGAWHSVTSCKSPCNRSTGISYPIPDSEIQFDSGQLGTGGAPTVNRTSWQTPADLPPGTYTFFCRIHPVMRGAIRVKPAP
ncbi:MAG: hypothetical protein M9938_01735 [Solirubrobacterales bacterium]|nr:hypothetical protein [Solirubrobacterales bacterium]